MGNPRSLARSVIARVAVDDEKPMPCLRSSRTTRSRPCSTSSSWLAFEKYERILARARGVLTMLSQSREGTELFWVSISTRSPICSS